MPLESLAVPRYGPPDALEVPRFSGVRTFMRVPHVTDLDGVDVAVVGIPSDDAVSYRSGARFGPEAIRSASVLLRRYNPLLRVDVAGSLSIVDWGDAPTVPGYTVESLERSSAAIGKIARAGVVTLCLGGDHTVLLAELRALAAVHGPLALVQLDAHHDLWDEYFGQKIFHGSVVRRAVEEGLVDPAEIDSGRPARLALRSRGRRSAGGVRHRRPELRGAGRDRPRRVLDARSGAGRHGRRLPLVRHRLRRPGVRARDGHSGGGRSLEPGGAALRPLARRPRLPRPRLRGGGTCVRHSGGHDRSRCGERVLRDAEPARLPPLRALSRRP